MFESKRFMFFMSATRGWLIKHHFLYLSSEGKTLKFIQFMKNGCSKDHDTPANHLSMALAG